MTKEWDFTLIQEKLKQVLPSKRFEHTLGVQYTSACLAFVYEVDVEKARLAGLLHDCAKGYSSEELIAYCNENQIPLSQTELDCTPLIHAIAGEHMARTVYQVEDEEVLKAIRYHTTGRPNMSPLEEIIFIADYMEPNRKNLPGLAQVRQVAFSDIEKAICLGIESTLSYLEGRNQTIDPLTKETLEYYRGKRTIR